MSRSECTGKAPLKAFPDYCYSEDGREGSIRAWAAEYVQYAHTELITNEFADIEQAKPDLRAELHILESEIN